MSAAFDVSWHWRAWRAQARWRATRQRVEQWLLSLDLNATDLGAQAQGPALILLGGSAGWMMSDAFLAQFRRILLVDLDPWAGALFKWNHRAALRGGSTTLTFQRGDVHAQLTDLLAWDRQACVLFDNFLGLDSMYTGDLKVTEERLKALRHRLRGRVWGSLHDRISGPGTMHWAQADCWKVSHHLEASDPLPEALLFASVQGHGEWLDHGTERVLPPSTSTCLIPWPIVPGRWHWLQAGWVLPGQG